MKGRTVGCLVARSGDDVLRFALGTFEARLGSGADCDIRLPFTGVSRLHALLVPGPEGPVLRDHASKNGLVVDGKRVSEIVLRRGVSVRVGVATVYVEDGPESDVELGLKFNRSSEGATRRHDEIETDVLGEPTVWGSGRETLQLIRDLASTKDLASATAGQEFLARSRKALGAQSLLVFEREKGRGARVGILVIDGPDPDSKIVEWLGRKVGGAHAEDTEGKALTARVAGQCVLAISTTGRPPIGIAAVFAPSIEPQAWQRDLFELVAERIGAGPAGNSAEAETARPATQSLVFPPGMVPGESAAMKGLLQQIAKTVKSRLDVLLLGETGTGKELFARMIHASGPTPDGPFVAINCAAIPHELLEAELFGIRGRVATGVDAHSGRFLEADGGTLFLDEIGEMAPTLQAKILRFLQEREVHPVGAAKPKKVQLRVISASNRNLDEEVKAGRFRSDLYYRLRGLQFHIPPLRDRVEDLPALVHAFAQRAAEEHGKHVRGVSRKALDLLMRHAWPGNVRELQSEVERAILLCTHGGILGADCLGPAQWRVDLAREANGALDSIRALSGAPDRSEDAREENGPRVDLREQVALLERKAIEEALSLSGGNKAKAARILGLSRPGLAMKLRRLFSPRA